MTSQNERLQLGRQLSTLADLRGISQVDLAKRCGISRISINRFFRGRSELKAGDLLRLMGVLGVDVAAAITNELHQALGHKAQNLVDL